MWRSWVACTRSRVTCERCHCRRTQICSADHRRRWRCSGPCVSGAALVDGERMVIPGSSPVANLCDPHARRGQRPAFWAGSDTRPRVRCCSYSKMVWLLPSVSSAVTAVRVHGHYPSLLWSVQATKKGGPTGVALARSVATSPGSGRRPIGEGECVTPRERTRRCGTRSDAHSGCAVGGGVDESVFHSCTPQRLGTCVSLADRPAGCKTTGDICVSGREQSKRSRRSPCSGSPKPTGRRSPRLRSPQPPV